MKLETRKFKRKIKKAKNILLLTHRNPDLDAFCSMLAIYSFLTENFPQKEVSMIAKQMPTINLPLMKKITIVKKIEKLNPDLVIVSDSPNLSICLEDDKDTVDSTNIVFIDHHKIDITKQSFLTINEYRSSATEQVYATFKDMLGKKLKITKNTAELIQYGIVSDTGRFLYSITSSDTFRIFAEVKDISPIDLEDFEYKGSKFPREVTPAIIKYLHSLTIVNDMAYMYINKEDVNGKNILRSGVNEAQNFLKQKYIRNIQGVHWGFIIRPDFDKEDKWHISFRSTQGYQDVSIIAEKLGGGGHKYASAVSLTGKSATEVIKKILSVISTLQS